MIKIDPPHIPKSNPPNSQKRKRQEPKENQQEKPRTRISRKTNHQRHFCFIPRRKKERITIVDATKPVAFHTPQLLCISITDIQKKKKKKKMGFLKRSHRFFFGNKKKLRFEDGGCLLHGHIPREKIVDYWLPMSIGRR